MTASHATNPPILNDARLGLALLIAMDFILAWIFITLIQYVLAAITRPFGMMGDWAYNILQVLAFAALFWPVVINARRLKRMVTAS